MYERFYGLKEKPFHIVPSPDYLYLSPKHKNALTHLEYGLMERVGFILLTGEIGTGKTTLIRYLLNQMEPDIEAAVIFNTNVTSEQLLNLILNEFDLSVNSNHGDKVEVLERIYQFLIEKFAEGKRVLVIVDEAQNLSNDALEEVRMLSNLQSDNQMLLQIMLVGHPELKEKLRQPALAQFTQRIAVNYHLSALGREDTGLYIAFRLRKAGGKPDLFTRQAIDRIFQASGGIPRSINLICDSSLTYGFADELPVIDTGTVDQVIHDKGGIGVAGDATGGKAQEVNPSVFKVAEDLEDRLFKLEGNVNKISAILKHMLSQRKNDPKEMSEQQILDLKKRLRLERKRNVDLLHRYNRLKKKHEALKAGASPALSAHDGEPSAPHDADWETGRMSAHDVETESEQTLLLPTDLEFPSDDKDFKYL